MPVTDDVVNSLPMSQLYARVFLQILDSSIAEDFTVRHIFEDFLKLSEDGIVDMTRPALSRRINCPMDVLNDAIEKLESSDPASRDQEFEGRRIGRLDEHRDWGWRILNWEKYEQLRTRADVAMRVDRHRQRKKAENFKRSTLEEVKLSAAKVGLSDQDAAKFFNYYESNGWKVGRNPMKSMPHALANWKNNGYGNVGQLGQKPLSVMEMNTVLKAKQNAADALKLKYCSTMAMGDQWNDEKARQNYLGLKKEIRELNSKIGRMA